MVQTLCITRTFNIVQGVRPTGEEGGRILELSFDSFNNKLTLSSLSGRDNWLFDLFVVCMKGGEDTVIHRPQWPDNKEVWLHVEQS